MALMFSLCFVFALQRHLVAGVKSLISGNDCVK